ncbi:MAG: hypothetical protein IJS79_04085 [Oscillospiraceae bacterium]|nr:hypothetical protein [Oscillospiraceae bacterium]
MRMRKTTALLLAISLIVVLCGCGSRNEEVKHVDRLIASISTVSLNSGDTIRDAREAYNSLSEEDQKKVRHYDRLELAEAKYQKMASDTYDKAVNWASVGSYDLAIELFSKILDYKDSRELYQRCELGNQILASEVYGQLRDMLTSEKESVRYSFSINAIVYEYKETPDQLTGSEDQWRTAGQSFSTLSEEIHKLFAGAGFAEVDGVARLVCATDDRVFFEYRNGKEEVFNTDPDYSAGTIPDTYSAAKLDFVPITSSDGQFWNAVTAAKKEVKDELKSPSTAKFPVEAEAYSVERSGNTYKVISYVDAENSFGAKVRVRWAAFFTLSNTSGSTIKITDSYVEFDE